MLKPTFRFFIVPLGAVCALATLSTQGTTPRAPRDGAIMVRQQVVDCSSKSPSEVCVVSFDGETTTR